MGKLNEAINDVVQNYEMGFVDSFDSLCHLRDIMAKFSEEQIENDEEREKFNQIVYGLFNNDENMNKAFRTISGVLKCISA